jgi:hypothetical protein
MHTHSNPLPTALTSALLLAAFVSSASAARLARSEGNARITYSPLSFVPSFGSTVRCPITLAGSYHSRTVTKTAGSLIGYVNAVTVGACESGRARANTESLPWHIQYSSFAGTLPNITSTTESIVRASFEIQGEVFGLRVTCRYTTPGIAAISTREARGVITEVRPGTESNSSETGGCPSARFSGTGTVSTPGGASIILSLV